LLILGLNAFHGDSAACLSRDGCLIAAAEEERFRRIKHWAGFPSRAIAYCLAEGGVRLRDIDHIALNQDSRANLWRKLAYLARQRPDFALVRRRLRERRDRERIPALLGRSFPGDEYRGAYHFIEHHLCHLFSAYYVSPFADAATLSVDGFGDFSSAAWGQGRDGELRVAGRVYFPHSIGIFYQALTQYLGFPGYGDEYKIMGLAPYGTLSRLDEMRRIVRLRDNGGFQLDLRYFRHHRKEIPLRWSDREPVMGNLFTPELEALLGPGRAPDEPLSDRHRDIARATQAIYEDTFFHMIEHLQATTGLTDIALAGGCAANSVANGKIRRRTAFRRVYVQSAAGDAGGAIGAAFATWHQLGGRRAFIMDHAYWGPRFAREDIATLLVARQAAIEAAGCIVDVEADEAALCCRAAAAIADGKIVGWFQGRMEWGPRALGNRSILCDPRRADMKAILNAKIKRRESFRPFAPSILEEATAEWFEENDSVPFMMQVFQIREEKRAEIPAVTHVDGSGRLQTVDRDANPRYYRLIAAFRDLTGVPMVLNTSFNENEPIVCEPSEALDCFLRTTMDMLVLEDRVITRRDANAGHGGRSR
jgi:carbamoyltransferase